MLSKIFEALFGFIKGVLANEIAYKAVIIALLLLILRGCNGTRREVSHFSKQDKRKIRKAKKAERKERRKQKHLAKLQKELNHEGTVI